MSITLRGYQRDAKKKILKSLATGNKAPLVVLPTGGGKTVLFADLAAQWASEGGRVWLVAHRRELIRQIAFALCRRQVAHKVIAPKHASNTLLSDEFLEFGASYIHHDAKVFVGSIQTIVRNLEKYEPPDYIVFDEAHHAAGENQYVQLYRAFPKARAVLFTATPKRLDGKGLGVQCGGIADALIHVCTTAQLIEAGYLCPYRIVGISVSASPNLESVRDRCGDFDLAALDKIINHPAIIGDAIATYQRSALNGKAAAFCVSVDHARKVADAFVAAGIPATSVDGTLSDSDRDTRLRLFAAGEYRVITSADLIGEGLDIPSIDVVMLLRPTKSIGLYLQQIGRGLRPSPAKRELIIIDHVGNVWQHGPPDDIIGFSLDGSVSRRSGAKSTEEVAFHIRHCEDCFATFPAISAKNGICPMCGAQLPIKVRKIKHRKGELVELTREEIAAQRKAARAIRADAATAKELAEKTGMSRARAEAVISGRKAKDDLVQSILHAARSWELRHRASPWDMLGTSLLELKKAKPKRLREIYDKFVRASDAS
jgi:superfamily II DNA or RNA helicase